MCVRALLKRSVDWMEHSPGSPHVTLNWIERAEPTAVDVKWACRVVMLPCSFYCCDVCVSQHSWASAAFPCFAFSSGRIHFKFSNGWFWLAGLIWLDRGGDGSSGKQLLNVPVVKKTVGLSVAFFWFVHPLLLPSQDEDFVTRDDFEDVDQLRIGNDGIFMLTFFSEFPNQLVSFFLWCVALRCHLLSPVAFLFNWIGFFLSFCLTTSAAGRYGAISGFGLSLIKWVLIVRVRPYLITFFKWLDLLEWNHHIFICFQFSTYFPGYFDGQYWLWWVFLVLGK